MFFPSIFFFRVRLHGFFSGFLLLNSSHPVCPSEDINLIIRDCSHDLPFLCVCLHVCSLHCAAAAAAKSLQSCPTLCDPIDGSPPGSPVSGILQARTLEWVAIFFSNAWKWKMKVKSLNHVQLLVTPWTAAYQAPPFMGFSRQEYWSGLPLPSPQKNGYKYKSSECSFERVRKNQNLQADSK